MTLGRRCAAVDYSVALVTTGDIESLRHFLKQEIAAVGTEVFRRSGELLRIDIDAIDEPRSGDGRFGRMPVPLRTAHEQQERLVVQSTVG